MKLTSRARVALAVVMALGSSAVGQTLGGPVPADSLVYVGWRGTADPGPGYAGSRWAAALKESNFGKLIDETLPAAAVAAERKWPQHGSLWRATATTVRHFIKHPSGAYLAYTGHAKWGVFCAADRDTAELTAALQTIADSAPASLSARVVTEAPSVGLTFGHKPDDATVEGIFGDATFKKATKQVVADPWAVMYVNVAAVRKLAADAVARQGPAEDAERFGRFIDASGFGGVNAYVVAAGFDGRDWAVDAFLDAPAPRKGLLALSSDAPLDAELIKRIPASADTARVFRLDAAALLNDAREITSAVDPQARDTLEKVIGASKLAVGRDLTTDLLPSLGTQWAAYTSLDTGGPGAAGTVLVNRLKNPAKAKQAMVSLSLFLSNSGRNLIPDKTVTLGGRMTKVGDLQVYYAATPLVSPAWTIKGDCLYLALYPQPVIEAARYAGPSIDTVPAFAELTKPKDGRQPLAVAYTDVPRTIDSGYGAALAGSRLLFGMSDLFLAPSPEPLLPTLPMLRAQATPATTTIWADDAGLHVRARSPFPGAETLATGGMSVAAVPLATSVLLPSLNRAREAANKIKSSSNLRQIGLASMLYANDNRDAFPPTLADVIRTQEITADVFLNPRTGHTLPPVPPGEKPTDFYADWVAEGGDYVYIGGGKRFDFQQRGQGTIILAYEKPAGLENGINVLFADGHVEWVAFESLDEVFTKAGMTPPVR